MEFLSGFQLSHLTVKDLQKIVSDLRSYQGDKSPPDVWDYSQMVKEILHAKEVLEKYND